MKEDDLAGVISERLAKHARIVLCGVGNDLRGDDGVGLYIVNRLLKCKLPGDLIPMACGDVPENYISDIVAQNPSHIIIMDAANVGKTPGTIVLVERNEIYGQAISTHRLPLSLFARIVSSQVKWEVDILVLGVQIESCDFGKGLTSRVKKTADAVVGLLARMLSEHVS